MTNKLEHCVPQSGRALRTLHMERRKTQKNEMKNARWRCGGGGRARRIKSYYVEISLRKWQRYCVNKRLFSFVCVKSWGYKYIQINIIKYIVC